MFVYAGTIKPGFWKGQALTIVSSFEAVGAFQAGKMATLAVETEYWQAMPAPNLLLGLGSEDEARLLAALACHRGEIARNPYHLTHPARLLDNVRRGAELVRSSLARRPGFLLGELYRLSFWRQGGNQALDLTDGWLGPEQDLAGLFDN